MPDWCWNGRKLLVKHRLRTAHLKALFAANLGWLCAEAMVATAALGQTPTPAIPAASSGAINLGGRGWSAAESRHAAPDVGKNQLEFELRGYRLSLRKAEAEQIEIDNRDKDSRKDLNRS